MRRLLSLFLCSSLLASPLWASPSDVEEATRRLQKLRGELIALRAKAAILQSQLTRSEEQSASLREINERIVKQLQDSEQRIAQLEISLTSKDASLAELRAQIEQLEKQVKELQTDLTELSKKLRELSSSLLLRDLKNAGIGLVVGAAVGIIIRSAWR